MFNLFKRNKESKEVIEKRKADQIANEKMSAMELNKELLAQCKQNVTYIEALLNTMSSQYHNIKTRGSERNKIRKENLKGNIEWYKVKLEEEKEMVSYYGVNLYGI